MKAFFSAVTCRSWASLCVAGGVFAVLALGATPASAQFLPGDILTSSFSGSDVQQYRANGTLVRTFTGTGTSFAGLDLTPDGNVAVAYRFNGGVFAPGIDVFSPSGTQIATFVTPGVGANGISVLPNGNFVISATSALVVYSPAGTLVRTISIAGASNLIGVTVAPDGTIYATDGNNGRLYHYTEAGTSLGVKFLGLDRPAGIAINPTDSSLFITDLNNDVVGHFTSTGTLIGSFPVANFSQTSGIGLAPDNQSLYTGGFNTSSISHYSLSGALLGSFPVSGTNNNPFTLRVVPNAPATPEPGSLALLIGTGISGAIFTTRRRNRLNRRSIL